MNGLSLFSGAGIGELALKHTIPNYRTVGYVEWDEYCCRVIEQRIKDGILDDAPIWQIDIREFNKCVAPSYIGQVDFISGGFPCQPFSVAGNQLGEADERNQWPATRDAISIIRPRYAFLENVPSLLTHEYIRTIFGDLVENGYDCEWDVVAASSVGALHRRNRIWVIAHRDGIRFSQPPQFSAKQYAGFLGQNFRRGGGKEWKFVEDSGTSSDDNVKPVLLRTDNGLAYGVDRLKAIGNGWVPQVVRSILRVK
jgi:DNA (cytosine-5)-methyltransferase 1